MKLSIALLLLYIIYNNNNIFELFIISIFTNDFILIITLFIIYKISTYILLKKTKYYRIVGFSHSIPTAKLNEVFKTIEEHCNYFEDSCEYVFEFDGDLWSTTSFAYIIKQLMNKYSSDQYSHVKFIAFKKDESAEKLYNSYIQDDHGIKTFGYLPQDQIEIIKWNPNEYESINYGNKKLTIIGIPKKYIEHWTDIMKFSYTFKKVHNINDITLITCGGGPIVKKEIDNNYSCVQHELHLPVYRIVNDKKEYSKFYNWKEY